MNYWFCFFSTHYKNQQLQCAVPKWLRNLIQRKSVCSNGHGLAGTQFAEPHANLFLPVIQYFPIAVGHCYQFGITTEKVGFAFLIFQVECLYFSRSTELLLKVDIFPLSCSSMAGAKNG